MRKTLASIVAGALLTIGVATPTPAVAAPTVAIQCKVGVSKISKGRMTLSIVNLNGTGNPNNYVHSFITYSGRTNQNSKTYIPTLAKYTIEGQTLGKVRGWQSGRECFTWYQSGAH